MKANVICFSNPIPKVYNILPPAIDELDEMIDFMYTGPCRPTPEDLRHTPLLVRLNKTRNALNWLKLNHIDYQDLVISEDNISTYTSKNNNVPVGYDNEELQRSEECPIYQSRQSTSTDFQQSSTVSSNVSTLVSLWIWRSSE